MIEEIKKPKTQVEISSVKSDQDYLNTYLDDIVRPTDTILKNEFGGDYGAYDDILRDDQVKSTFAQRRLAVVSKAWFVEPGGDSAIDKAAADFLNENLLHIGFDNLTDKMLYGIFYGFAVSELIWDIKDGKYWIDKVKVRDRSRFKFKSDGTLNLVKNYGNDLVPCHEPYFWKLSTGATHDDEPYGLGLAHYLYWPVLFKKGGTKFRMKFVERFAQPSVLGKFKQGSPQEQVDLLLETIQAIASETGAVMPDDMDIQLLESSRSSSSDYSPLNKDMNEAISKIVLSQTMTTDNGSSQSQANVHMDVLQFIIESDDRLICESFLKGPAKWLTELNFAGAKIPLLRRKTEPEDDSKERAERDNILYGIGARPTQEYIDEHYGSGWIIGSDSDVNEKLTTEKTDFSEFAESLFPDQLELDKALDSFTDEELNDQMAPIIMPILDFAEKNGPQETLKKMSEVYNNMDIEDLTEQLTQVFFIGETQGRVNASK